MSSLFERLKQQAGEIWDAYIKHPYVMAIEDGTLTPAVFQEYLLQDYLFLIQFSRAYGLAVYKSRTLEDMKYGLNGLKAILEQEITLHEKYCHDWGIENLNNIVPNSATIAYTRYVLDVGIQGDLLDLHVALSPCVVGYWEIGMSLAQKTDISNPYASWIAMYSSREYQEVAETAINHLQDLGDRYHAIHKLDQLQEIFNTATRMEAAFWPNHLVN